ncbi:hypothetical protein NDU88_001930 [Pleurodeles waltl]|uniref:Uncharacterized protein n=1 Tax=Pleurodeles waltl TaxID=8319 RepID=A0AAV7LMZ0_PLEWA|nr:hypothetical protein NDU88_001930 [Pleurodeles waltl]
MITAAVKCAGVPNWIHASHTKKVTCPTDEEVELLKVPTTEKEVSGPESNRRGTETEEEPVEDGLVTPVTREKRSREVMDPYPTSPDRRYQTYPVPPQKRPTVMTAALHNWIKMTSPAHQGPRTVGSPDTGTSHHRASPLRKDQHSTHPAGPSLCLQDSQSAVCPPLQGTQENPPTQENQGPGVSGSGHTDQETEAQDNKEAMKTAVRQGEDMPREPTLHEALSNIMGAYHHSQETMATVLAKFQETQRLQEEHYLGIREDLKSINNTLVTTAGVLQDLVNTRRDTVPQQGAPDTSLDNEQPFTSAGASGQEAPPQEHNTSTPADGEPPRKRSLRSRNKTENIAKTPARKCDPPFCHPSVPLCHPVHPSTAIAPLPMPLWTMHL